MAARRDPCPVPPYPPADGEDFEWPLGAGLIGSWLPQENGIVASSTAGRWSDSFTRARAPFRKF